MHHSLIGSSSPPSSLSLPHSAIPCYNKKTLEYAASSCSGNLEGHTMDVDPPPPPSPSSSALLALRGLHFLGKFIDDACEVVHCDL